MPRHAPQTWIRGRTGGRAEAAIRLLCFPFAGGGASAFGGWQSCFPDKVEVCAIQYPGREIRWGEAPPESLDGLVSEMAEDLEAFWEAGPFALLGHSYGALVAFELARSLVARGAPIPLRLFLSGARAPHLLARQPMHGLPDREFLARLRRYDGMPEEVLRDRDLMALSLPILRHDFRLFESHRYREADPLPGPLPVPLSVFGGLGDANVPIADLLAWSVQTGKAFRSRFFEGNHFFLFRSVPAVTEAIVTDLAAAYIDQATGAAGGAAA